MGGGGKLWLAGIRGVSDRTTPPKHTTNKRQREHRLTQDSSQTNIGGTRPTLKVLLLDVSAWGDDRRRTGSPQKGGEQGDARSREPALVKGEREKSRKPTLFPVGKGPSKKNGTRLRGKGTLFFDSGTVGRRSKQGCRPV